MTPLQLEAIVLDSIDRLQKGNPIEDDRVELKRDWPDHTKARQLAGAANKSNGDEVIYIIGADEKTGAIHPHNGTDVANWWAQMSSRFDEVSPELLRHINVPLGSGESVVALLFSTDRAPYLVKMGEGGSPERDIPFRDGTRTRSVKRAELLRLLIPQAAVPMALLLNAEAQGTWYPAHGSPMDSVSVSGNATIFLEHTSSTSILLPKHETSASLSSESIQLKMAPSLGGPRKDAPPPPLFGVHTRSDGVVATGPGVFVVHFHCSFPEDRREELSAVENWTLGLSFGIAGSSRQVTVQGRLARTPQDDSFESDYQERLATWSLSE